jgi:hypothetical protein
MMEDTANLFISIIGGTDTDTIHLKKVVNTVKRITQIGCHRLLLM